MQFVHSDECPLLYDTLQKLSKHSKCCDENISKLRHHKLINNDCSLTLRGKKFMYASMLNIPVTALEILIVAYDHRKIQTCTEIIPMSSDVILTVFKTLRTSGRFKNIKILVDSNLLRKIFCKHFLITDSAFTTLGNYDKDISEIEDALEY